MQYKKAQIYRSLVAIALLTNGFFQAITPVLAEGTTAGETISNTATATYVDPNNPDTPINVTSNTVTLTVAEVAGITVSASGVQDSDGGTVEVGDSLKYTYTLTNVGNDPTRFRIPNLASTTGPATVSGNLEYSTDGGANWQPITDAEAITSSIAPGGTVLVRVPVSVQAGAQNNDIITVRLGNTPGDAQNQLRSPDGGDVYTVDNENGTAPGEVNGAPVNGTREASATQQITVAGTAQSYALATILKVRSDYDDSSTPQITDDKLTYSLGVRVESNDVTGTGITPAPLVGTSVNVDGADGNYILVSDAIPAGTQLGAVPTPPPGWQAVYTTAPIGTNAANQNWKSFPLQVPDTLAGVTRVGFINIPAAISAIAPGTTVNGFTIQLNVKSDATSPLTVANIAQLFGQTAGNNFVVYDESGDQNPSNFNGSTAPANLNTPGTDTNNDGTPDTFPDTGVENGLVPDTGVTGIDTGNNNTGTGAGGEANVFTIQAAGTASVLNGPQGVPNAVGPTDNNDDFTNKSFPVPLGTAPGSTLDPQVAFTNTLQNSGTDEGDITLAPTKPANVLDLPDQTRVTLSYNAQSVVYTYDQATGNFNTTGTPITIPDVAPGVTINYGVEVDLPANTPLSTDTERGFPVPITATIVVNGTPATNTTINRVYTGFLKLIKLSRILQGTGPAVGTGQDNFDSTPPAVNGIDPNPNVADVLRNPAPGNIIEYQIRYTNISDPLAGSGNVILNAAQVVITEDGTTNGNNWALDNDSSGQIDTSNIVGTAKDSGTSTIQFFNGNPANNTSIDQTGTTVTTDVTKYINSVTGTVAPGVQRTFTFQRKLN